MKIHHILSILLACFSAFACSPIPRAVPVNPTAPSRSADVSPIVEVVRGDAAKTSVVSARLEGQVANLQKSTATLKDGMAKSLAESARLRDAKMATEAELDGLWKMLTDSNVIARQLFDEAEKARDSAAEQKELRIAAESNLVALTRHSAARDAETAALRQQHQDMSGLVNSMAKEIDAQQASLIKAEKKAAVGSYLRGGVIVIAIVLVVLLFMWLWKPRIF